MTMRLAINSFVSTLSSKHSSIIWGSYTMSHRCALSWRAAVWLFILIENKKQRQQNRLNNCMQWYILLVIKHVFYQRNENVIAIGQWTHHKHIVILFIQPLWFRLIFFFYHCKWEEHSRYMHCCVFVGIM